MIVISKLSAQMLKRACQTLVKSFHYGNTCNLQNHHGIRWSYCRRFLSQNPANPSRNFDEEQTINKSIIDENLPESSQAPTIIVTEKCLQRIEKVLESDEMLRVGIRGGGCSGFEYEFTVEKNYNTNEDLIFHNRVIVDRESMQYLNGAKVDFQDELIRSGFLIVDNPIADKSCSCGVSFGLKMNMDFSATTNKPDDS